MPLKGFPVVVRIPVLWGDVDAYGHVNNAIFFTWFEQARMEYLARCRFIESYEKEQVGAILHSTSCRFRKPVFHPDTIEIGTRVTEVGEDRFTMEYTARSASREEIVAEGSALVVSYDYQSNRKTVLPSQVRAAIDALEGAKRGAGSGEQGAARHDR